MEHNTVNASDDTPSHSHEVCHSPAPEPQVHVQNPSSHCHWDDEHRPALPAITACVYDGEPRGLPPCVAFDQLTDELVQLVILALQDRQLGADRGED